jgi:hypothetical protein
MPGSFAIFCCSSLVFRERDGAQDGGFAGQAFGESLSYSLEGYAVIALISGKSLFVVRVRVQEPGESC